MSVKKFLISLTAAFLCFSLYAQSLPNGYGGVYLGMSLDEAKKQLLKNPDFGYNGDRDVYGDLRIKPFRKPCAPCPCVLHN